MVEHDDGGFESKLNRERENILKVMTKGEKHSTVMMHTVSLLHSVRLKLNKV